MKWVIYSLFLVILLTSSGFAAFTHLPAAAKQSNTFTHAPVAIPEPKTTDLVAVVPEPQIPAAGVAAQIAAVVSELQIPVVTSVTAMQPKSEIPRITANTTTQEPIPEIVPAPQPEIHKWPLLLQINWGGMYISTCASSTFPDVANPGTISRAQDKKITMMDGFFHDGIPGGHPWSNYNFCHSMPGDTDIVLLLKATITDDSGSRTETLNFPDNVCMWAGDSQQWTLNDDIQLTQNDATITWNMYYKNTTTNTVYRFVNPDCTHTIKINQHDVAIVGPLTYYDPWYVNNRFDVTASFVNNGDATETNFKVYLNVDGVEKAHTNITLGPGDPSDPITLSWTPTIDDDGIHTIKMGADVANDVTPTDNYIDDRTVQINAIPAGAPSGVVANFIPASQLTIVKNSPFELAGFDIYNFNPSTPLENVPVKLELPSELEFNGDVAEKVVNVPAGGEVYVSWHLKTKSQTANPSVTGRIFNSSVSGQYANRSILIKNYTDSLVADVSVAHGLLAVYIVNQGQTFTINSYVYNWTDGPLSGIILEAIEENGLEITSGQNPVTLSMIDPQNQSTPDTTWQVRYTTAGSKTLKVRAYYQDQGYVEGTMLVTVNPVVAADKETNEISTKNSNKKNSIFGHLMK